MSSTQDSTCEQYVHRIADFLKQGTPFEEVSSTISSVMNEPTQLNIPIKKVKKEKKYVNLHNQIPIEQLDTIERLPTGRVRYGPVVVNPRKKPSKTIFTGRRSKNEVLYGEEEEKRRSRRERNRAAAARCREKREKCKQSLEQQIQEQEKRYQDRIREIEALRQRKEKLEFVLHQMFINFCETVPDLSENVDLNTSAPALLPQTLELVAQNEDEFENLLINSSNDHHLINIPLDNCQEPITITSSSLNRMIDECAPLVDTTNNILYNSAYGLPTCAQQYSSSSSNEDDSMASIQRNSYVY